MRKVKVLCFSGSIRSESYNQKLVEIAAEQIKQQGAEATLITLKDFDMPLYNGDLEAESGLPDTAKKLKALFCAHDGFLIASPEYNTCLTPLLKNTLDWVSRSESDKEAPLVAYQGKVAGLIAASPGGLGGLRGLVHLRMMLSNIGVHVIPNQMALPQAFNAFNKKAFKEEAQSERLKSVTQQLIETTSKIRS